MEALLEQLVHSPKPPFFVEEMQTVLAAEQEKRQAFYEQITEDDKAEFINGEIIMHSPVRLRHINAGKLLLILLDACVRQRQSGFVGYEKTMISLTRNDYEPDLCFFKQDEAQAFTPEQLFFPASDFVV